MDNVSLDRAERLVTNQNKDLLLFLQADEVTEPRPLSQSASERVFDIQEISSIQYELNWSTKWIIVYMLFLLGL